MVERAVERELRWVALANGKADIVERVVRKMFVR